MDNVTNRSGTGITFDVSDVSIAAAPLVETNIKAATEKAIDSQVESCGEYSSQAVMYYPVHGLFAATGLAFQEHRPLVLSPDIIWLTIAQGLSEHINLDPEKHRSHFVSHEGQKTLQVQRHDFVRGALENPWNEVFTEFGLQIREHIGHELYQLIIANFSTTGDIERAASEIALMSTVKAFFRFEIMSLCGIPRVTLEGSVSDWIELSAKIDHLRRFSGLDFWLPSLKRIADQFVATARGEINREFWIDMYKIDDMSGGPYINGWLSHLIPYVDSGRKVNPCLSGGKITEPQLPTGVSTVPFLWNNRGSTSEYEFLAGLMTVQQDSRTLALRPRVGWAVRTREQSQLNAKGAKREVEKISSFGGGGRSSAPLPKNPFTVPANLSREEYESEIVRLSKLIVADPKHLLHRLRRGSAFACLKQFDLALADFDYVIQMNRDLAVTYAERAKVYRVLGRTDEADRDKQTADRLGYNPP